MKCPKCGYEFTEPDNKPNDKGDDPLVIKAIIVIVCIGLIIALACTVAHLNDKPDKTYYSGGCHVLGNPDDDVLIFQYEEVWYMMIPDNASNNLTEDSTTYNAYYWNETQRGWVLKPEMSSMKGLE